MIGPVLEGITGVVVAIVISLTEERDFFIYCIPAYPVLFLSSWMMWKYQKGIIVHSEKYVEDADDFSTEMIVNYQTAQSFGFTDELCKKYEQMLRKNSSRTNW